MSRIADLLNPHHRYRRSTHLERDFSDPTALDGYVLTQHTKLLLERVTSGLNGASTRRAWRITGDYGSGKSSFALFLTHLLSTPYDTLPATVHHAVESTALGIETSRFLPVLITGSREPVTVALLRGLQNALHPITRRQKQLKAFSATIQSYLNQTSTTPVADEQILSLLHAITASITQQKGYRGVLIILDELGKFLEFAALYPERQDAYLLQQLAEMAARSGEQPIVILGLLHQGLSSYTTQLAQRKEWEKVASRFEEIVLDQAPEQMITLVAEALHVQVQDAPAWLTAQAQQAMRDTLQLEPRWYGTVQEQDLLDAAVRIYPLHPTVLPVLIRLFKRFGHHERSLFSFLFSNEPAGLQAFAHQPMAQGVFYRLHHLYDYARAEFGHVLSMQSYRNHWHMIDAIIQSVPPDDDCVVHVLKTVGLLNVLNSPDLLPTEAALLLAVSDGTASSTARVQRALHHLHHERQLLHYRGAAGGFCLWPHTSVNLETVFEQSGQAVPQLPCVGTLIPHYVDTRPIIARRHAIETGNLRYFAVKYVPHDDLDTAIQTRLAADGGILIVLCETEEERQQAIATATAPHLQQYPTLLVAVTPPLKAIAPLVRTLQRWQWVKDTTRELISDTYAAEEVSRQLTAARTTLTRRLHEVIGLHAPVTTTDLRWFRQGTQVPITTGRSLLETLSQICTEVYDQAPRIQNELVNRQTLSSAATAARMRLIERILEHPSEPLLGLQAAKNPPEMAMYRSVLHKSRLHREVQGVPTIAEPDDDICHVLPTLHYIHTILTSGPDQRVPVSDIFSALRQPPYGVRDGLMPVLLAVFVVLHQQHVALYEERRFLSQVCGFDFMRLIKAPHTFEIQYCTIAGVRTEVFQHFLTLLEVIPDQHEHPTILDVVRPLCTFAAQLPTYTHKTRRVSDVAQAVRHTLLTVSEPAPMLFWHLPIACGVEGFGAADQVDHDRIHHFMTVLKAALDELQSAFLNLHQRLYDALLDAFHLQGAGQEVRQALEERVQRVLPAVREPHLKAFCLRLVDGHLAETAWIESLASLVCSKPPRMWVDADEQTYYEHLTHLCTRFQHVERIAFAAPGFTADSRAFRLAVTQSDGTEVDQVLYLAESETEHAEALAQQMRALMQQNGRIGLAAASRAVWQVLTEETSE
jgi:hypothetical protein